MREGKKKKGKGSSLGRREEEPGKEVGRAGGMDRNSDEATALETLKILHPIITLSAERLDGLRTQCTTSAEITHQEIRTLEVRRGR